MKFKLRDVLVEIIYKDNELLFNPYNLKNAIRMKDAYDNDITVGVLKNRLNKLNDYEVKKISANDIKKYLDRKGSPTGERFITERGLYKLVEQYKSDVDIKEIMDYISKEILPSVLSYDESQQDIKEVKEKKLQSSKEDSKADKTKLAEKQLEVREMAERNKMASLLLKLSKEKTLTEVQSNLLLYKAIEVLLGRQLEEVASSSQAVEIKPIIQPEPVQVHKEQSIPYIPLKEEQSIPYIPLKEEVKEQPIILTDHTTITKPSRDDNEEINIEYNPRLDPTKKKLTKEEFRKRWLKDLEDKRIRQEKEEQLEIYGEVIDEE